VNLFELGGYSFRGKFLSPEKSLDLFAFLSPAIGSALDKLSLSDLAAFGGQSAPALEELADDAEPEDEGAPLVASEAAAVDGMAKVISAALTTFRHLPKVAPFFLPVYQVAVDDRWMALTLMREQVFTGRASLQVAFTIAAAQREYADFLGSRGLTTFADLGKALGLKLKPKDTGQSGGS
jgi:hypothetical protein